MKGFSTFTATAALALLLAASTCAAAEYSAQLCGKEEKYTSPDGAFVYGSNAWNPTGTGFQCLSIDDSVPALDATWLWDDGSNVHSFPHVRFHSPQLPARMSSITSLRARVNWTMAVDKSSSSSDTHSTSQSQLNLNSDSNSDSDSQESVEEEEWIPPRNFDARQTWLANSQALEAAGVVANVAWDFFADSDKSRTYNPVDADTEIMVWLGRVGNAVPLRGNKKLTTMELSGVDFDLYHRKNFRGHNVFTWLPATTNTNTTNTTAAVTHFFGDLAPLLTYVLNSGLIASDSWLGLVEFGSEAWFAPANVTFTAVGYAMELERDGGSAANTNGDGDGDGDDESGAMKVSEGSVCAVVVLAAVGFAVMMSEGGWR